MTSDAAAPGRETSGIAASRRANGVWWLHNDSGDSARVFAVGNDGRDLGEYALTGAAAVDWEDIAVGPGPAAGVSYVYLADIGDNARSRTAVQVYRVPEPLVDTFGTPGPPLALGGVENLTFTYPDGPHDAEALLVDPSTGQLFVITKDLNGGVARVFRAPAGLGAGSTTVLTPVATVSLGAGRESPAPTSLRRATSWPCAPTSRCSCSPARRGRRWATHSRTVVHGGCATVRQCDDRGGTAG